MKIIYLQIVMLKWSLQSNISGFCAPKCFLIPTKLMYIVNNHNSFSPPNRIYPVSPQPDSTDIQIVALRKIDISSSRLYLLYIDK